MIAFEHLLLGHKKRAVSVIIDTGGALKVYLL